MSNSQFVCICGFEGTAAHYRCPTCGLCPRCCAKKRDKRCVERAENGGDGLDCHALPIRKLLEEAPDGH